MSVRRSDVRWLRPVPAERVFRPAERAGPDDARLDVAVYFGAQVAFAAFVPDADPSAVGDVAVGGVAGMHGEERCLLVDFGAIAEGGVHTVVVLSGYEFERKFLAEAFAVAKARFYRRCVGESLSAEFEFTGRVRKPPWANGRNGSPAGERLRRMERSRSRRSSVMPERNGESESSTASKHLHLRCRRSRDL